MDLIKIIDDDLIDANDAKLVRHVKRGKLIERRTNKNMTNGWDSICIFGVNFCEKYYSSPS